MAYDELRSMITGYRLSAAIAVAADLGLSDLLVDGPRSAAELADAVGADAETLHRLLRALVAAGVYAQGPDGRLTSTALGDGLRSDAPASLRPLARTLTDPALWAAWGHLGHSVRTGDNAFEALHGVDVWTHRERHPDHNEVFNQNMRELTSVVADAVASSYDFSTRSTVVDVGGGQGTLLEAVLSHHEHLSGTVFDQPHALPDGPGPRASASVAGRWSTASGSFFDDVPSADVLLLKSILHDWSDDACVQVLRTCRRALRPGGVVLVIEMLLGRAGFETEAAFSDVNMLVMPGGRERTQEEYAALLTAAGLRLTGVVETPTHVCVLEAQADDA